MSRPSEDAYGTVLKLSPIEDASDLVIPKLEPADAAAAPETPPERPGRLREGSLLSHYRILRVLGQGGMGQVYEAEDTRLQRIVALKVMLPEVAAQPSARERFLREARMMAAIRHDHVATIFEVDQTNDVPFLAMEFLHGQTLQAWLAEGSVPRQGDILRIGREIATGLAAAHARGLIHRDIKPANIWLEEPTGRVKILDFGLARPMQKESGLTRTGDVLGTPHYMAPEQARGEAMDERCDLFSLGVVLYQLCTQEMPFQGASLMAVLYALATEKPVPVRERNPNLEPALADLVMQLLAKDPAKRPQSAQQVIAALQVMEGQLPPPSHTFLQRKRTGGSEQSSASSALTQGPNELSNTLSDPVHSCPSPGTQRRQRRRQVGVGVVLGFLLACAVAGWHFKSTPTSEQETQPAALAPNGVPLRLGILYSRTGTMGISERPILDGALLAIQEINEKGGVLDRPVEAVVEDGQSEYSVFARKAAKLIEQDEVCGLLGCWTSASRKAVKTVVEQKDHLLLYPVSYEGMEQSENIVYGGSVPNQQILPALKWSYGFLNKKRWFLVGSDSLYSHAAHAVIRDEAKCLGSQIVGDEYVALGSTEVAELVRRIAQAHPDLIINTINGDTNVAFFRALRPGGLTPDRVPVLSFAISEEELSSLAPEEISGHYAAGNYFQSIELVENQRFLRRVQAKYGPERIVSDPMQTAYTLVHLWSQAVRTAGEAKVQAIRRAMKGQRYDSPQGPTTIDAATLHTVQVSRVGRINDQGRFIEVYASPQPIRPEPFPASRPHQAWEELLKNLYEGWGRTWCNPGR
jgi:urea transport system substrate-binding protein